MSNPGRCMESCATRNPNGTLCAPPPQMLGLGYSLFSTVRAAIPTHMIEGYLCHEATVHFQREDVLPWWVVAQRAQHAQRQQHEAQRVQQRAQREQRPPSPLPSLGACVRGPACAPAAATARPAAAGRVHAPACPQLPGSNWLARHVLQGAGHLPRASLLSPEGRARRGALGPRRLSRAGRRGVWRAGWRAGGLWRRRGALAGGGMAGAGGVRPCCCRSAQLPSFFLELYLSFLPPDLLYLPFLPPDFIYSNRSAIYLS